MTTTEVKKRKKGKSEAQKKEQLRETIYTLFKAEDGLPLRFTPTQIDLAYDIATKRYDEIAVVTPTQYGKTEVVSCAVVLRAMMCKESWSFVGATESKARILMSRCISHCGDNELVKRKLKYSSNQLERLFKERNRDKIDFVDGGGFQVFTANAVMNVYKSGGRTLLGEGAQNVVIDDSPLIPDPVYDYIYRMTGGRENTFRLELGNAIRRNHFYRMVNKVRKGLGVYHIDWRKAVVEGRFSEESMSKFRDDMSKGFFRMMYDCVFPDESDVDESGYMDLLTNSEIDNAVRAGRIPDDQKLKDQLKSLRWRHSSNGRIQIMPKEIMMSQGMESPDRSDALSNTFNNGMYIHADVIGVDVAGGICENVFVKRTKERAVILSTDNIKDTMATCGKILSVASSEKIGLSNIMIDMVGLGQGIYDRLVEQGHVVQGIKGGESATDPQFFNKRAQNHWYMRQWIIMDDNKAKEMSDTTKKSQVDHGDILESSSEIWQL